MWKRVWPSGKQPRTQDLEVWGCSLTGRVVSLDKELYSTLAVLVNKSLNECKVR